MATEEKKNAPGYGGDMPPSPPDTEDSASTSSKASQADDNDSTSSQSSVSDTDYPLPPPSKEPTEVLDQDKKTPDGHVPRDPRLIRLTGVHPFNVEAPLSALYDEGFLTSPELFYVRNHGPVPEVHDEDIPNWEFSIEGLVENPFTISLKDLISEYDNITCPVTLVCAGNRRKEQNIVRKSKGFSWGPAGVSTALFTGVTMWDVIKRAKPMRKARFVCMEGADKLPNGHYGTSVKLNWVRDPNRGIMLAHGMNGEPLRPDHGKPLRVVIPGQIGGRSVKWLKKLIMTEEPSDNWYHIYDNRVLPTMVSPDDAANDENWWKDERYAIYDLSANSAIAYPAHEEQLCLVGAPEYYRIKGYAYGGGGRRITRVEVTIDTAKTWRLAEIDYPEDRYREADEDASFGGGRIDMHWRESSFCWCFWTIDIPVSELADAKDILVRSMDESMTIQPRDMYWSVLGMMNNPWFRITISKENDYLRFEHPCQPALMPGGWMERVKKAGGNLTNGYWGERVGGEDEQVPPAEQASAEVRLTKEGLEKAVTIDELRKHDNNNDKEPWFVVGGEVFDGTAFLNDHPGGAQSIISSAGMDASDEFMAIHSETAKRMMPDYHIGTLDEASRKTLSEGDGEVQESGGDAADPPPIFLHPRSWRSAKLTKKEKVSADTVVLQFTLDTETQTLGLPTGQHLMIRLRDPVTREAIIRPYTPISHEDSKGTLDVLVKIYFASDANAGGKMSQALNAIPVGHTADFKGPIGKFVYHGSGKVTVNEKPRTVKHFVMICAGSGVTPIFQVFRSVMMDAKDPTRCTVLDGNRLVEDILCRDELDQFAKLGGETKCKVFHTLTQGPEDWQGLRGRIAAPLIKEHAAVGEEGMMALICGPEAMENAVHKALVELGWKDEDLLFF